MTSFTIEQIKELLSKVTPTPLSPDDENHLSKDDVEFIAQSKEIIQWLLDRNEQLSEALDSHICETYE